MISWGSQGELHAPGAVLGVVWGWDGEGWDEDEDGMEVGMGWDGDRGGDRMGIEVGMGSG